MLHVNGNTEVAFKAVGPMGLSIDGRCRKVQLKEDNGAVVVSVLLDDLDTGIWFRDHNMKEQYLETGRFPKATLEVHKSALLFPNGHSAHSACEAELTLHGVTRAVHFDYHAEGTEKDATVHASMLISLRDFKISPPSYLGVSVKPTIEVSVIMGIIDE